jgi:Ca-activated chloride channel family protein
VDSDPVPSPDGEAPPPAPTVVPTESGSDYQGAGHFVLRADAYEVRLNASVIDSSGAPVDSLPQDAFQVYEDGVPQTIRASGMRICRCRWGY